VQAAPDNAGALGWIIYTGMGRRYAGREVEEAPVTGMQRTGDDLLSEAIDI
jgi:hypothetical protein